MPPTSKTRSCTYEGTACQLPFLVKNEQRFDAQERIYGLVICHNRVILRTTEKKAGAMWKDLYSGYIGSEELGKEVAADAVSSVSTIRSVKMMGIFRIKKEGGRFV